jgi:hypothetical protein
MPEVLSQDMIEIEPLENTRFRVGIDVSPPKTTPLQANLILKIKLKTSEVFKTSEVYCLNPH